MASNCDEPSYLSPPKRLKLDENSSVLCNSSTETDSIHFGASSNALEVPTESNVKPTFAELQKDDDDDDSPADLMLSNSETNAIRGDEEEEDDDDEEEEDDDDVSSTVSNLSELSGLSDMSGQDWKCIAGPMSWVQKQMVSGVNPRTLLGHLLGEKFVSNTRFVSQLDDISLWKLIVHVLSEPPRRQKLRHINTLSDVIHLLKTCSRIMVLTGAGVSVSCGIPDFRSRDGIYSRLAVDFPNLPDPQAMFDINYFRQDPRPFFKFAREIYPGQFKPSPCHRFIKKLEENNKLLRNYTQNIDTLEQVAGIKSVVECHGSFATASCTQCSHRVTSEDIREEVYQQKIPICPVCANNGDPAAPQGVMKPDIVFFGEGLPESFHKSMAEDKDKCDLLIVIGSSLKVRPVALIPSSLPSHVPQVLINRERLPHLNFDVELLGDGDIIIDQICHMMGENWTEVCWNTVRQTETDNLLPQPCRSGYNTECSEGEGEMSVDWSRDCERPSSTISPPVEADALMEEEEIVDEGTSAADTAEGVIYSCGECGKTPSQPSVKCRKIRRVKVRDKSSSSTVVNNEEREFNPAETDVRMSIEQEDNGADPSCLVSRRHLSMDSTRDSGIGDGSNSSLSAERHMSVDSQSDSMMDLASRLPENTYFFIRPNRYIFQGAEVLDEEVSSSSSNSDAEVALVMKEGPQQAEDCIGTEKSWSTALPCSSSSTSSAPPPPCLSLSSSSLTAAASSTA